MRKGIFHLVTGTALAVALSVSSASAQKKYDTGATDTEIKIGQTNPFSGPASAYATIGKTQAAYMKMINDQGGVNGRKINLIQYDDAYSPPKAVEQVRKLVESDEVLLTFQLLGTPSNAAVQKYLNSKKVPQLFAATGASKFTDPKNFPWTMGFNPNYFVEGRIYGQYIMKEYPNAKIGVLYQNDDLGKDYLNGIKAGLGDKAAKTIVAEAATQIIGPEKDSVRLPSWSTMTGWGQASRCMRFARRAVIPGPASTPRPRRASCDSSSGRRSSRAVASATKCSTTDGHRGSVRGDHGLPPSGELRDGVLRRRGKGDVAPYLRPSAGSEGILDSSQRCPKARLAMVCGSSRQGRRRRSDPLDQCPAGGRAQRSAAARQVPVARRMLAPNMIGHLSDHPAAERPPGHRGH